MSPLIGAPSHRAILASAGSGKTFQLANRYIGLMALGVDPDRILAITFSRKAAGEIFDKVLNRLAEAADSESAAAKLAGQVAQAGFHGLTLDRASVLALLRRLVVNLHLARISTLDSFFVSILRAFPFEFGLGGDLAIVDQHASGAHVSEALRRTLREAGRDSEGHKELLEEFKQATFGQEDKTLAPRLREFVTDYQDMYLEAPREDMWGGRDIIWPDGPIWAQDIQVDLEKEGAAFLSALCADSMTPGQWKNLEAFANALGQFHPVADFPAGMATPFFRLLEVLPELDAGSAGIKVGRTNVEIAGPAAACAARIVRAVMQSVLELKMQRTRGIYRLLRRYEQTYDRLVRRTGKLTFSDIQLLLAGKLGQGDAGPSISLNPGEGRLYVDYRLDASLDHWLLDEFQDTSTVQWLAMHNLVDEVVQDRDGTRSLFYVGDVKQAIHYWRGGDSTLFERLLETYNQHETRIETTMLSSSYRSSPVIMEGVNRVFDNISDYGLLPEAVVERWNRRWASHEAVNTGLPGVVELVALDKPTDGSGEQEGRYDAVCSLIAQLDPVGRGLSSAVLVKSNKNGRLMVELLRQAGIEASRDGAFSIVDNPVCSALVSLLVFAVHPGDTMAREHLAMTPLGAALEEAGVGGGSLAHKVLREVCERGFEPFVRHWGEWLRQRGALDAFGAMRLEQMGGAAMAFDNTGERNPALFIDYVRQYEGSDPASRRGVQVMTMHKSKGLEFDLVFLPDLDGCTLKGRWDGGVSVSQAPTLDRGPRWVLDMPKVALAVSDPVLARHIEERKQADMYESLCLLYVSMTRARQCLFMVTTAQKADSAAVTLGTLVRAGLRREVQGQLVCRLGNRDFLDDREVTGLALPPEEPSVPAATRTARRRLEGATPSGEEAGVVQLSDLFSSSGRRAAALGTAVHELFSGVGFSDECDPGQVAATQPLPPGVPEDVAEEARALFLEAFAKPEVPAALARPGPDAQVWREQPFEAVVEGRWVTGVFDRVVLRTNDSGLFTGACILDFKTDRVQNETRLSQAVGRYAPQLELYRQALARLTGLPGEAIETRLLFVRTAQLLTTPPADGQ